MAESRVIRDRIAGHLIQAMAWLRNLAALEGDNTHLDVAAAVDRIADAYRPPVVADPHFEHSDERAQ